TEANGIATGRQPCRHLTPGMKGDGFFLLPPVSSCFFRFFPVSSGSRKCKDCGSRFAAPMKEPWGALQKAGVFSSPYVYKLYICAIVVLY
ncbi:hypothetical protein, partial [uncultured Bacteroides sp.]|uniref:hypothetical protein n=1 Tax=uncultured Bacteroides sp. TaxID=162156 RepID=UPI002638C04F